MMNDLAIKEIIDLLLSNPLKEYRRCKLKDRILKELQYSDDYKTFYRGGMSDKEWYFQYICVIELIDK